MNTIKIILTTLALAGSGFAMFVNAQVPVPYPEIPTTTDTKVEGKDVAVSNSSTSSSSDGGTLKDIVSINTGGKAIFALGSLNIMIEGGPVSTVDINMQNQSRSGASINCQQFPNHCNVVIYEFMKKELPPTKLRSIGNKSLEEAGMASKSMLSDFRKKVRSGGLWVRLSSGKWIRIDENVMLTKAVINQLWRKGK